MCSDAVRRRRRPHDSFFVRRIREAGFVIVGKTTLPEMGILPTSESRRNGPTRIPGLSSHAGRLERRLGGRGRRRHGPCRARQRRRRLDPDPRCVLRPGRPKGRARARLARPALGAALLVTDGVLTRTVGRDRPAPRHPVRLRAGRHDLGAAPDEPFAESRDPRPRPAADRAGVEPPLEGSVIDPVCIQAARDAAALLASLGHEVRRSRLRGPSATCFRTSAARSARWSRSPSS